MNTSYTVAWKLVTEQEGVLTCLAISPKGTRLIVASESRDILLVDFRNGCVLVKLDFESQFSVLSAFWYSEENTVIGCCNGGTYDVCFEPTNNEYRVTMCPFLPPFSQQIRSLAFDPSSHRLAIGYGTTVALFHYPNPGRQYLHTGWKPLETIRGPYNNESGLVHTLLFYPTKTSSRRLLVGYAESGWNVWSDVGPIKRISSDSNHNVCRIGRATLTSDEKSLAVSTLDHTIVTYALGDDGPILESMKVFPYGDSADYSPIVPIASTPEGLTLSGTARGELPVIGGSDSGVSLLQHEEPDHVIRAIGVHGDKIIVGSSSWAESVLKCYSTRATSNDCLHGKKQSSPPILTSITEALAGWEPRDSRWKVTPVSKSRCGYMRMSRAAWVWMIAITIGLILVLSADPPNGASFDEAKKVSDGTDVMKPVFQRHEYWVIFGFRHFLKYLRFQCRAWTEFTMFAAYKFVVSAARLVPEGGNFAALGIGKWICERVEVYKDAGVCPKIEY